jgi:hypothetical protein
MISLPDTHKVAAPMIDPVASVPMNESMFIFTTTIAFSVPIASPATRVSATASPSGRPSVFSAQPAKTPEKPIVEPIERSKTPAASGITTASAARPVIAYWLTTVFAVWLVGKRLGFQTVKMMISTPQT